MPGSCAQHGLSGDQEGHEIIVSLPLTRPIHGFATGRSPASIDLRFAAWSVNLEPRVIRYVLQAETFSPNDVVSRYGSWLLIVMSWPTGT